MVVHVSNVCWTSLFESTVYIRSFRQYRKQYSFLRSSQAVQDEHGQDMYLDQYLSLLTNSVPHVPSHVYIHNMSKCRALIVL